VASFQVIEHFADARPYLAEVARILRPEGTALFSTPNRLESDGENPFHLREYTAEELAEVLSIHFEQVEVRGIRAHGPAARYHAERLRQIRRMTRLDPLGLRRRLPRGLVDWAFARLSVLVRLGVRRSGAMEQVRDEDYRVETASGACIDLLALCRRPRPAPPPALP
jgi:SAM-dependent methyltransferase